jgi:hypothetical protein
VQLTSLLVGPLLQMEEDWPAGRDPVGAPSRLMAYRLTWGRTGLMLSNVVVIGSLVLARLYLL